MKIGSMRQAALRADNAYPDTQAVVIGVAEHKRLLGHFWAYLATMSGFITNPPAVM